MSFTICSTRNIRHSWALAIGLKWMIDSCELAMDGPAAKSCHLGYPASRNVWKNSISPSLMVVMVVQMSALMVKSTCRTLSGFSIIKLLTFRPRGNLKQPIQRRIERKKIKDPEWSTRCCPSGKASSAAGNTTSRTGKARLTGSRAVARLPARIGT